MSYADDQLSAAALIAESGQAVTLTPPGSGAYSTGSGTVSGSAGTPVTTTGVVLPISRGLKHMPGTDIAAGDQQLLLPGSIAQPVIDTLVQIGPVSYTIKEVAPLNPGGTPLLYDCVIRGAQ